MQSELKIKNALKLDVEMFFEELSNTQNFIVVTDKSLKIIFINKLLKRALVASGSNISIGENLMSCKHGIFDKAMQRIINNINNGNALNCEDYLSCEDDSKRKFESKMFILPTYNENEFYYCFLIDSTKEIQFLRREVDQQYNKYSEIKDENNKINVELSQEGIFINATEGFYKIFGGNIIDYSGKIFSKIIKDSHRDKFTKNFELCKNDKITVIDECRAISYNGVIIWIKYTLKYIEQLDGDRIILTLEDISTKKLLEYLGTNKNQQLENIYNKCNLPAAIIDNSRLCIERVNERFCEIFKEDERNFLDRKLNGFWDENSNLDINEVMLKLELGLSVKIDEFKVSIRKEDKYIKVELLPFKYNNVLEKIFCTVEDITEKKKINQLEEEKKQKEVELLALKQYEKIRTEFLANISHEFKTPLNVIYSAIQSLEYYKGKISSKETSLDSYGDIMKHNCYRLLRLVDNMMDISLLETGEMTPVYRKIDLVKEVEDITLSTKKIVGNKGISLIFDTNVEEFYTYVDYIKLQKIILNILSNSVKFTDRFGSIQVTLNIDEELGIFRIAIKDTGRGISRDNIPLVFERFRQVDKSLTRDHEGIGIGLYLVREMISLLNGELIINSDIDVGTEIMITIPVIHHVEKETEIFFTSMEEKIERANIELSDIYIL